MNSTTNAPTVDPDYIPDTSEVTPTGGSGAYRFAEGKIVRGQQNKDDDGRISYAESLESIVGRLKRVGIFSGVNRESKTPYTQIEADIQTASGLLHLKSALTDDEGNLKPSVATIGFAFGLTQVGKNELIRISTSRGEPVMLPGGKKGGRPTYVNFGRVNEKNQAIPIYKPRRDANAPKLSLLEQWAELEPLLKAGAHPAYEDREANSEEEATHFGEFCKECEAKGWPTPEQMPQAWLGYAAKGLRLTSVPANLKDISDDQWGSMRQALSPIKEIPKAIQAAVDAAKTPATQSSGGGAGVPPTTTAPAFDPNAEYDPHADKD